MAACDLIGPLVLESARERTWTDATEVTPILPLSEGSAARLRGATTRLVARNSLRPV